MASVPDNVHVFRSRFNQISAVLTWLICAAATAAIIVSGSPDKARYLPIIALFAVLGWIALWRPSVLVGDDEIVVVNVMSTIRVPWAALIQVDTRYALTLFTPRKRVTVTAAPAPGRLTAALGRRDTGGIQQSVVVDGRVRPGDLPTTDSGAAAFLVRQRWEELSAAGRIELGAADRTPVVTRWHWPSLALCAVLLVGGAALLSL